MTAAKSKYAKPQDQNRPGAHQEMQRIGAAQCQPRAQHEKQLPRERVEIPNPRRIGGQVPAELAGCEIEQYRSQHAPVPVPEHQPEHRRKGPHQDDVKRQDVEVQRLVSEQQPLRDRFDRGVQQGSDIKPVDEIGSVEPV